MLAVNNDGVRDDLVCDVIRINIEEQFTQEIEELVIQRIDITFIFIYFIYL